MLIESFMMFILIVESILPTQFVESKVIHEDGTHTYNSRQIEGDEEHGTNI